MNILKRFRKSRSAARAQIKAAQARARAEVKHADKATARREKLLTKAERQLVKSEEKDLKRRRKHEHKQAKLELQKLREGRVNSGTVKRYAGTARAIAPLALPLIYRGLVALRQRGEDRRAHSMGLTSDELSAFSGHGASLKARTNGIRKNLAASALPAGFQKDAESRLDELDAAIDNAEYMTAQQRRRAHASIQGDIDGVTDEIQRRITSHQ